MRAWIAEHKSGHNDKGLMLDHCLSTQPGVDGTTTCSVKPHRHRVLQMAEASMFERDTLLAACDNHVQGYLADGWIEIVKICTHCCTNQAEYENLCGMCQEALTAPERERVPERVPKREKITEDMLCENHNRDSVPNCGKVAEYGTRRCAYCRAMQITQRSLQKEGMEGMEGMDMGLRKAADPHVRLIVKSSRPCNLKKGCAGRMLAAVYSYQGKDETPHLWWKCEVCHAEKLAEKTTALPDPMLMEPINSDMQDMAEVAKAHVRTELAGSG